MKQIRCKMQSEQMRARIELASRIFCYVLSTILCFILALCTSLGPIFRDQDIKVHLGSITDFSWINALIFIAAFAVYATILWTIIYYGKHASFPKQYSRFVAWIKSIFRKKHKTNTEKTDKTFEKADKKTNEIKSENTATRKIKKHHAHAICRLICPSSPASPSLKTALIAPACCVR